MENEKIKGKCMKKIYIWRALTILWMVVIFSFSAKTAEKSAAESGRVGILICQMMVSDFEEKTKEEQILLAQQIDYPIRKCAHASEYAVLGVLLFLSLDGMKKKQLRGLLAWLGATLYAITDEVHQFFVPGRACQLKDMCIDSVGALAGILVLSLFFTFFHKCFDRTV